MILSPDASLPPPNEAIIAKLCGDHRTWAGHARERLSVRPKDAVEDAPVLTRGMPRGLFGRNDLMAAHSKPVSS
jgi:hypothetical protein